VSIVKQIEKLKIIVPKAPKPVGAYLAYKQVNNLVYVSGQLPIKENGEILCGKIGADLSMVQGKEAAILCTLNILAQIKDACGGKLDKIKSCIKITGYINSTEDFKDQPKILNASSELISNIFGQNGLHARVAVSVNALPLGAAVEIDAIFEVII
jgi:enamine deaminase RidA (YjgF/YER057c/UK114 family)|tara:strand:+ start:258 stop:722 length:465 start_codon:yes stop_codon:yes gene_type:complete